MAPTSGATPPQTSTTTNSESLPTGSTWWRLDRRWMSHRAVCSTTRTALRSRCSPKVTLQDLQQQVLPVGSWSASRLPMAPRRCMRCCIFPQLQPLREALSASCRRLCGPESRGPQNRFSPANPYCELGFAIAKIENRGTRSRGKAFEGATYLELGGPDLDDQVAGVKAILKEYPGSTLNAWVSPGIPMAATCRRWRWSGIRMFFTQRWRGHP